MKIFYEKVGKKYVPVKEYDDSLMSSFSAGSYLIRVNPGFSSTRMERLNEKEEFDILATLRKYESHLLSVLIKESEMVPTKAPLTKRQKKAWKELEESYGGSICTLQGKSWQEIIDKLHYSIIAKIKEDRKSILLLEETPDE